MKYLTKEWYQKMQNGCLHLCLIEINKAEHFTEEYFYKVYKRQENHDIEIETFLYEIINNEKIYVNYKGSTRKQKQKWKKQFLRQDEDFKLNIEKGKKNFNDSYNRTLKYLESNLPKEILNEVADIRLLALNRCTPKVKKLITEFSKNNDKFVHECYNNYLIESSKSFGNQSSESYDKISYHDGFIHICEAIDSDLVIRISDVESGLSEIIFKNYKLLSDNLAINHATWLYEELYKNENGLEVYVLFEKENELIEFGVFAKEIVKKKLYN